MPALARRNGKDFAFCEKHTCKKCGNCNHHPVRGPATPSAGANRVLVNGFPALRETDPGQHDKQTCCGPNKWIAQSTIDQREVNIQGKPAFCVGDITLHDQKDQGKMMSGSPDVFVGKS